MPQAVRRPALAFAIFLEVLLAQNGVEHFAVTDREEKEA